MFCYFTDSYFKEFCWFKVPIICLQTSQASLKSQTGSHTWSRCLNLFSSSIRFCWLKNRFLHFLPRRDSTILILYGQHHCCLKQSECRVFNLLLLNSPLKISNSSITFLVKVIPQKTGITDSQQKYILDLFKKTNTEGAEPVQTQLSLSSIC